MVKKKPLTEVEKINREINELEDRVFRYLVKGVDSTKGFGKNLKNIFDPEKGILNPTTLLCMVAFFDFGEEDTHSVEFSQPSFPV